MDKRALKKAIDAAGGVMAVSKAVRKSYQAVTKWVDKGRLPRTEWTGETDYASVIERLCIANGCREYTRDSLLELKSTGHAA